MVGAERALFRGAVQWVANARWDGRPGLRALVVALRPDGPRRDRRACFANVPRHAPVGACLLLDFAAQAHRSRRGSPLGNAGARAQVSRPCAHVCGWQNKKTPALRPASLVADHSRRGYLLMSTSLVSFRNRVPMMKVITAITIGYHRPA